MFNVQACRPIKFALNCVSANTWDRSCARITDKLIQRMWCKVHAEANPYCFQTVHGENLITFRQKALSLTSRAARYSLGKAFGFFFFFFLIRVFVVVVLFACAQQK